MTLNNFIKQGLVLLLVDSIKKNAVKGSKALKILHSALLYFLAAILNTRLRWRSLVYLREDTR